MKMEAAGSSEILVAVQLGTQHQIPEDSDICQQDLSECSSESHFCTMSFGIILV
jgi:hypothetical protein